MREIRVTIEVPDDATPMAVAAIVAMAITARPGDGSSALGQLVGVSRQQAHRYVRRGVPPSAETARRLAAALGGQGPTAEELRRGVFDGCGQG